MGPSRAVKVTKVEPNALSKARAMAEALADGLSPAEAGALPALVDNSTLMYFPPIKHQEAGDCTCFASAYYYNTFLQAHDEGLDASGGDPDVICSPRFLFALIAQGSWGAECTEHAMARLSDVGCANLTLHPYDTYWTYWPTEAAWIQALNNRTGTLYEISGSAGSDIDLEAIKTVLANGSCVVTRADFGANYDDYRDYASGVGIDNHVMYRRDYAGHGNRHSMCIVGYDDNKSYHDDRDGQTHSGAFILANSEGPTSDWYNSTGTGTKGFMWIAYRMFLNLGPPINQPPEFGYYDWEGIGESPCFDNEDYPTVYYHDDRPDYRPSLYAVAGINHEKRNMLRFTGGVGSTGSPEFTGPDAIERTNVGAIDIYDTDRVAVDLSDGAYLIAPDAPKQVFVQMDVDTFAGSNGTITSADFFHDPDGDGVYNLFSSTDPTVTVTPGSTGFATVDVFIPNTFYVDDSNTTGPWDGTRDNPFQTIQDAIDSSSVRDTVYVFPGTYAEAVELGDQVSLIGAGPATTVIHSQNAGEAVLCSGVTEVLVEGFTLTTGGTSYMALRSVDSTATVRNCVAIGSRSGFGVGLTGGATLVNCMSLGNSHQGIYESGSADVEVHNATIVDNGVNGIVQWGSGSVALANSILWGNGDDVNGVSITASHCDIEDGDFELTYGNISQDPLFVTGPLHAYCLSQTAAGQGSDSPCVDTGSDTAANLGLDDKTTRTDGVDDTATVDMGYHGDWALWITDVYWEQATTSVVITFASEAGVDYALETAEADAYADSLDWSASAPVTAGGSFMTMSDNLTGSPLGSDYRFYRVKRDDGSETSWQTAAVFELDLNVGFAVRQFFVSTPLILDPDHNGVDDVFGTQLDYPNVKLDKLDADAGLCSRATYTPGVGWANSFAIVAGEGYMLDVGDAYAFPHTVRLTGYVPAEPLTVSVTRASFAVSQRWMAYSMPRATTLGGLGLETAITPFWEATNEVRLLPLGATLWQAYCWDGVNWVTQPGGVVSDATPIACGEGILFIHNGVPSQPDVLTWPTWYLQPPNM